jgi:iron complex transport system substrate-binding protein
MHISVSVEASRIFRLVFALLLACSAHAAPRRIISTGPSITELLFALDLGDRIVGATEYCTYPPEARNIPRIGNWMTPNMEAIIAARPDLVIVQKTQIHDAARFRSLKIPAMEVELNSTADIYKSVRRIGAAAGVSDRAVHLVDSLRSQMRDLEKRVATRPPTTAMFIVGRTPGTLEGIISVGGESFLSEIIGFAGGKNVFSDSRVAYPKVLHEEILARDPEVIIDMGEHADASGVSESQKQAEIALWSKYPSLRAYRNKRIHIVASDLFVHPGPRVAELTRELARIFHPDLFR